MSYEISKVYNPGNTKPINTSFEVNTQTSNAYIIDEGTAVSTANFDLSANTFASIVIVLPSGNIIVGETTTYKFNVTLTNAIPSSGGKLLITFPDEITVYSTGSCTALVSSTSHN